MPLIKVENLTKYYGKRPVLDIPHLEFYKGGIYSLFGPNGSGKTTLLNILSLLDDPTRGKIFLGGEEVTTSSLWARRKIGMVAQDPFLFHTTVERNVGYGLAIRGVKSKERKERVRQVLSEVGLVGFETRGARELSGGEAQKMAIARTLAFEPEVLFMDEPTANIDKRTIESIEALIRKINESHSTTIIFTTHSLSQAYRMTEEVISLIDGTTVAASPENLFAVELVKEDGLTQAVIKSKGKKDVSLIKVNVVTEKTGPGHILIDPGEIIVSGKPLVSSARNHFSGLITGLALRGAQVRVCVDVAGLEFVVIITHKFLEQMGLKPGSEVYLTFKTSIVTVF
ncbi:MAG: ATP-binding cassette domain-containing protein [bacterium]|nr:ATP-binding cassette domain-containing protein [bacterium]